MIVHDATFFKYVLFSDESTFKNTGELSTHNCHYWSDVNPYWYSVIVWCEIVNGCLIGPYFFQENVNRNNFLEFLRDHLPVLLEEVNLETRQRMWFQLDGAAPHYIVSTNCKKFSGSTIQRQVIGRRGPITWPACSSDLTPPDFIYGNT
ncbi:hypothetical protein X777_05283 [Ooceraea biroi]|uniref:Tc1-like transposase DDE domain-containing protein n=1 Tax=Ooceraea biroi TaxID=2015173 RepID=A0A026WJ80_OOCBI|nr:hypothetical protein X777_05283 [Ooceraea biroi]